MTKKTEWRQYPGRWDEISFIVVFDPDQTMRADTVLWPDSTPGVDAEELEVLELAGRLASLKPKRSKKH